MTIRCFSLCILLLSSPLLSRAASPSKANAVPLIYQPLGPTSVKPGSSAFKLVVSGTGFTKNSVVHWNGKALSTTRISNSRLGAEIPASFIKTTRTASVTVSNPGRGKVASNVQFFVVSEPSKRPKFVSFVQTTPFSGVSALITADLNGDGNLDIAGVAFVNFVFVMLGNGDGTFQPAVSYPTGQNSNSLVAADFNGDGRLDLAVTNLYGSSVSVLLGNGDGTFQPEQAVATAPNPYTLFAADLNRDGKLDLVVGLGSGPGVVSILIGNGDGTFQPHFDFGSGGETIDALTVGDFNRDGILDLVTLDHATDNATVLLGLGDGNFEAPRFVKFPNQAVFPSVTVADFNGDGKLDLAVAWQSSFGGVYLLLGDGRGGFPSIHNYLEDDLASGVAVGDFNADGQLDLVFSNLDLDNLSLLLGKGKAKFQGPFDDSTGAEAFGVAVGDFNGDGKLDVALPLANGGFNSIAVLLQQ